MTDELKFEHFAINVEDPVAVARWYCDHLGMKVVRQGEGPVHMHFLADATGRVVLELYTNPPDLIPDYASQDPQVLHIAFAAADMGATITRLTTAGATLVGGPGATPAGDQLAMLRDPWGFAIQLTQRATSLV
jgi:glyoxylase I family protein